MDTKALYKYLKSFMKENNWLDENVSEQARAIFTTICLVGNFTDDIEMIEIILLHIYRDCCIDCLDITYEAFENYMLELII